MDKDTEPLWSSKEVADYLGVSLRSIVRWVELGILTHYRIGDGKGQFRFRASEIEEYLEANGGGREHARMIEDRVREIREAIIASNEKKRRAQPRDAPVVARAGKR